ncbi:MAG: patatin-like phospholipase family protein [Spirochaetes bacterium]|nr:patatin-like phospholipase family protein [Spirochaetota bacterium]
MASYKNLVFKGGGVRGIAYVGALRCLYEKGLMRSVERVAGTSAGAITATLVALHPDDFASLKAEADSLDYARIPSERGEGEKEGSQGLEKDRRMLQSLGIFKSIRCTTRLLQDKGWYSSGYLYSWMKALIARRFAVAKEAYTFSDFQNPAIHKDEKPFLDLFITGTDISNRTVRVFSFETTPDMEVAKAVTISMSIPLYFEARSYQYPGTDSPQVYADGGVMWNYPRGLFDDRKYGRRIVGGINEETLGFFLYASPESTRYKEVRGFLDYIGALFESLLLEQERTVLRDERQSRHTIFIDDLGVPQTQFEIGPSCPEYAKLMGSGYAAAEAFLGKRFNFALLLRRIQKRFGRKL